MKKLYLPPGGRYFGCRRCYDLTYESAQQHDKRVDRLARSARSEPPPRGFVTRAGYIAVLTMRPLASTYHFSLGKDVPFRVAAIQSAMTMGGKGPRFAAGTLPTE